MKAETPENLIVLTNQSWIIVLVLLIFKIAFRHLSTFCILQAKFFLYILTLNNNYFGFDSIFYRPRNIEISTKMFTESHTLGSKLT